MKVRPIFAWFDLWIGAFWDKAKRRLYVFPVPMFGLVFELRSKWPAVDELQARLGAGPEAIEFALQIDDHHDMRNFLATWQEGSCLEWWPEFDARDPTCRPAVDTED